MPLTLNFNLQGNTVRPDNRKFLRQGDGDGVFIEQPVRLVSIDTPESLEYFGGPDNNQPKLDRTRERIESSFFNDLPVDLRTYLLEKLTDGAAERHQNAGDDAKKHFAELLERRLTQDDGTKRDLAVMPSGELIAQDGRMLAYVAPWFKGTKSDPLPPRNDPRRHTFNLEMIRSGWAAFFPIYPSLPGRTDMDLAVAAAEDAWNGKLGAWERYGNDLLLGYEYRASIKLAGPVVVARKDNEDNRNFYSTEEFEAAGDLDGWEIERRSAADLISEAFARHCVDISSGRDVGKHGFHAVPPCYRLWYWEDDAAEARRDLGFS